MYTLDSLQGAVASASAVALTSSADGLVLTPGSPIEIIQFGYIMTTAVSGSPTSGFVASLDKRTLAGSDTGRVTGAYGTLTLTNAQVIAAQTFAAANTSGPAYVLCSRPAPPTTGEGAFVVLPGQQAVLKVTTALTGGSAAGSGIQYIIYKNLARGDAATGLVLVTA